MWGRRADTRKWWPPIACCALAHATHARRQRRQARPTASTAQTGVCLDTPGGGGDRRKGTRETHTPPPPTVKASDGAALFFCGLETQSRQNCGCGPKNAPPSSPPRTHHPSSQCLRAPRHPPPPAPPRLGALVACGAAGAVCGFAGVAALVALVTALGDGAHVVEPHQVREWREVGGPKCEGAGRAGRAGGVGKKTLPPPIRSSPLHAATHSRPRRHRLPAHRLAAVL